MASESLRSRPAGIVLREPIFGKVNPPIPAQDERTSFPSALPALNLRIFLGGRLDRRLTDAVDAPQGGNDAPQVAERGSEPVEVAFRPGDGLDDRGGVDESGREPIFALLSKFDDGRQCL